MNKLLTIIIPVYNVEAYIKKCLDSLILDDADLMARLEVIIVNDGTPDRSAEISREYVKRYPDTFRQIDKMNGNYGSCINCGLKEAKGSFIKVLDADDWFDSDVFPVYLRELNDVDEDIDLVITVFDAIDENGELIYRKEFSIEPDVPFHFQEYPGLDFFNHHAITYRTRLLSDIGYQQTEGISHTDIEWVNYPQLYVGKCIYKRLCLYHYLLGRVGQTMNPIVLLKNQEQILAILSKMVSTVLLSNRDFSKSIGGLTRLKHFILVQSKDVYRAMLIDLNNKDFHSKPLKQYDSLLRKADKEIYAELGKSKYTKNTPFRYIAFWRQFGIRFPIHQIIAVKKSFQHCLTLHHHTATAES